MLSQKIMQKFDVTFDGTLENRTNVWNKNSRPFGSFEALVSSSAENI